MTDPAAATPIVNSAIKPTTPLSSKLAQDWHWLTQHLIALVIVAGMAFGGVYFVENLISHHDEQTSQKYATILAAQTQQTQTLQKQLSTDEANWAQVEAQLLAQNAQLTKQITARNQAVAIQVQTDATLSATDAAARLTTQTHAAPGEVLASGNDVTIDLPITRAIVSDLDQLPVVQDDLADTKAQLVNETTVATNAQTDATDAKKVIAAQVIQLADADKSCKAQIAVVNANARKGKLKWFGIGWVAGFVSAKLLGV